MTSITSLPYRRFGRTGIDMPVLSLGGMRFQQSWEDIDASEIKETNQELLEKTLSKAALSGLNHIETARHYGSSERQLGWAFQKVNDSRRLIQTKVPPNKDPKEFESQLALSFQRLGCERLDLLAIHGINLPEHLEQTLRPNGCLEVVRRWQRDGRIGHVGFSTHGSTDLIVTAIESNQFDYVNLHWYFIRQQNEPALAAASKFDLGVFIISPTDKGGHLHTPSLRLLELCEPIHPIIFNDLFCLRDHRVHTISVGLSKPEDLDLHLQSIDLMNSSDELVCRVEKSLNDAAVKSLGKEWMDTWHLGLPSWQETPGNINVPILLWLHNLLEAWDMEGYAKARYGLLGRAGHWFPGSNADVLDDQVSEEALKEVLINSPWASEIPEILRSVRRRIGGQPTKRLWGD